MTDTRHTAQQQPEAVQVSCSDLRKARFQALSPPRQVLLVLPLRGSLRSCLPCSSFLHATLLTSDVFSKLRPQSTPAAQSTPWPPWLNAPFRPRRQGSTRSLANCRCRCAIVRRNSATSAALARKSAGL